MNVSFPLAQAIIRQESAWDPYAIRYEPEYNYLFTPEKFKKTSFETEIVAQKISWGLGQLMGALLREQGLTGFLSEALDPTVNITHLCKRIKTLEKISSNQNDIIAMYNGGPGAILRKDSFGKYRNQAYVDSVNGFFIKGV